jgi:transcriptional regulator with XRE-family HTH domain
MSQTELADRAKVNIKSLSRYELRTSVPPADVLKEIADALGVTADALLSDDRPVVRDRELLKKFEAIQEMDEETKTMVNRFIDLAIRDFRSKQSYSA